jgi:hypothetical protein
MTLVLACQAEPHAVVLTADSLVTTPDGQPHLSPKLFVRNACGIITFGCGHSVPETIERGLVSNAWARGRALSLDKKSPRRMLLGLDWRWECQAHEQLSVVSRAFGTRLQ